MLIFTLDSFMTFTGVLTPTSCLHSVTILYEALQKLHCTQCSSFLRVKELIFNVTLSFVEVCYFQLLFIEGVAICLHFAPQHQKCPSSGAYIITFSY